MLFVRNSRNQLDGTRYRVAAWRTIPGHASTMIGKGECPS